MHTDDVFGIIIFAVIVIGIINIITGEIEGKKNKKASEEWEKEYRLRKQEEEEKEREKQLMLEKERARYKSSVRYSKEYSMVYNKIFNDIMAFSKSVKYVEEVNYKISEVDIKRNGVIFYEYKDFEFSEPFLVCDCIIEDLERMLSSNFKVSGRFSSTVYVEIHNGDKKVI